MKGMSDGHHGSATEELHRIQDRRTDIANSYTHPHFNANDSLIQP